MFLSAPVKVKSLATKHYKRSSIMKIDVGCNISLKKDEEWLGETYIEVASRNKNTGGQRQVKAGVGLDASTERKMGTVSNQ